jgi:hypothetical protein
MLNAGIEAVLGAMGELVDYRVEIEDKYKGAILWVRD